MISKKYVALHCCPQKYANDIIENGLYRDSKAFFLFDFECSTKQQLLDTLAILIYHGVGIHCWNEIIHCRQVDPFDVMQDELIVFAALVSQSELTCSTPCVYHLGESGKTSLMYYKVKETGPIREIVQHIRLQHRQCEVHIYSDCDPVKDRFFSKNVDDFRQLNYPEEIRKWCYYIADMNLNKIIELVFQYFDA